MKKKPLSYPVFDTRDGAKDESMQLKTWGEKLPGLRWNEYCERSFSGCSPSHDSWMRELVKRARKAGETIIGACYHNFAVSIIVRA